MVQIFRILAAIGLSSAVFTLPAVPASAVAPRTPVAAAAPRRIANTIHVKNETRALVRNYPLQFGRPFLRGAIPAGSCPQTVIVNNATGRTEVALSQADIKNRYPDGSAEFAVMAVVVPGIPGGGAVTLSFVPGACANTPLTRQEMLDARFNFDVVLRAAGAAAGAATQSASARAMLANGDYRLWTAGPVAQTVILGDDSAARKYDIGFGDGHRPLRPRFYATFWPQTRQVFVRAVAENDLTGDLEDLTYKATILAGEARPAEVYSVDLSGTQARHAKKHWAMTVWTRRFWLGGAPPEQIDIDDNLAYLASTRFLPNYDASLAVPESAVADEYALWSRRPHDVYDGTWDGGVWQSSMPAAGARQDIAPYPQWTVLWLYTGDWRLRQMALGMADLAGAFPANLRESAGGKRLSRADPAGASTGLGHAVSITDRPTLITAVLNYGYTKPGDAVKFVGPRDPRQPFEFDGAHQPSPFYPQYLVTGDRWYLQEMYLWAGFSAARYNGATTGHAGRGPTGSYGGINDQLRGAGWVLRNRAETAFIAPDADPEKAYFTYLTNDALARWEGSLGITGTPYDSTAIKLWGAKTGDYYSFNGGPESGKPPPFGNWESNARPTGKDSTIVNNERAGIFAPGVGSFTAPWMHWYLQYALGRTAELGFAAAALRADAGQYLTGMIDNSGYPQLIGAYEVPVERNCSNGEGGCTTPPGGFYMSWTALAAAMPRPFLTGIGWANSNKASHLVHYFSLNLRADGRPIWAQGGLAEMVDAGDPGAAQAWRWFLPNVYRAVPATELAADPKWAIVPRIDKNQLPPQPTATPPA